MCLKSYLELSNETYIYIGIDHNDLISIIALNYTALWDRLMGLSWKLANWQFPCKAGTQEECQNTIVLGVDVL